MLLLYLRRIPCGLLWALSCLRIWGQPICLVGSSRSVPCLLVVARYREDYQEGSFSLAAILFGSPSSHSTITEIVFKGASVSLDAVLFGSLSYHDYCN